MEHQILAFVNENLGLFKTLGYYFVFLASFFESFPVIGFLVPGQAIIVIFGFLAKKQLVSFWLMFFVVAVGAVLGDLFAFFLGKKYGEKLLKNHGGKFFLKPKLIADTQTLVKNNPGKALFFGRLNSVTRSLSPFVSGMSGIRFSTFFTYCITSCALWAGTFLSIGYIFGKSFEVVAPIVGKFILIATILVFLLIALVSFMKKKGVELSRYHIQMLVLNIISLYVFASISEAVARGGKILVAFDERIRFFVATLHTNFLDKFFTLLSYINTEEFIAIIILVCVILIIQKHKKDFYTTLIALTSAYFFIYFVKIIFERPRPPLSMIAETGFAFPSGHSAIATLLFLTIIHNYTKYIVKEFPRFIFVSLNAILILLFSFSRIYLGVHYASDVLAGIALGAWIFSLTILASRVAPWFYRKIKREQIIPNL